MEEIKLTKGKAGALLEKVRSAVAASAQADFDLCWLLYECDRSVVYVGDEPVYVYETWGYRDWFQFVEIEVGVHEKTANHYRKVGEVFGEKLQGAWDSGKPLMITKMIILASWPELSRKNVKSKMRWAANKTCCEVQHELLGKDRAYTLSFSVSKGEQRSVNKAIDEARSKFDDGQEMTRGELMANIVSQWMTIAKKQRPKLKAVS